MDERRQDSGLNDAIQAGALVGGGILAYKNRRAIASGVRRIASTASQASGRTYGVVSSRLLTNPDIAETMSRYKRLGTAISDGLGPNTGLRRATRNVLNPDGTGFTQRLYNSIDRQSTRAMAKKFDPIEQAPSKMSKYYFDNIKMRQAEAKREAFSFVRHREVQKAIKEKRGDLHSQNIEYMMTKYANSKGTSFMDNPTVERTIEFLTEFSGKGAKDKYKHTLNFNSPQDIVDASKDITDILTRHKNARTDAMKPFKAEMKQYEKNIKKIQIQAFQKAFSKDAPKGLQARLLEKDGYKQATWEEYRNLGLDIDTMRVPKKGGEFEVQNMLDEVEKDLGKYLDLKKMVVDPNVYIKGDKVLDMRGANRQGYKALEGFQDMFQMPFLRFNPLDLAHFTTVRSIKEMPETSFLKAGEMHGFVQHNLKTFGDNIDKHNSNAIFKPLSRGGYMYAEGGLYDFTTGELVDDGLYLGSAAFGPLSRMHLGMGNVKEHATPDRGIIKKTFDLGGQQSESFWESTKQAVKKFDDPFYGPNIQSSINNYVNDPGVSEPEKLGFIKKAYGHMYGSMNKNALSLSDEAIDLLAPNMNAGFARGGMNVNVNDLVREDEIMEALGEIVKSTTVGNRRNPNVYYSKTNSGEPDGLLAQIHDKWSQYVKDPRGFLNTKDMEPDKSIVLPDMIAPVQLHEQELLPQTERVKRLIHQYGLRQMEMGQEGSSLATSIVEDAFQKRILNKTDVQNVRQLETLTDIRNYHNRIYSGSAEHEREGLLAFAQDITDQSNKLSDDVQRTMREFQPWYAAAPQEITGSLTGSNTTLYRKRKSYRENLAAINESYKEVGKTSPLDAAQAHVTASWDVMKEMFAGRKSPDKVTTLTAFPYYYSERLDNAVSGLGLGLSQENRGSAISILGNQWMRRIVLPYVAYQQAMWLDGQTGDFFSDKLADTYVNMHEDLAWFKETSGINQAMKPWAKVFSGADQIEELPFIKQLDFLTLGAFSDWRSDEDVKKYYESGEDPIRRGRYWGVGSSNPWSGGAIEYFAPNWYRQMKSDYQFTDTMYGSEDEYWANHWMPTLTNPLAPIRHFFTDPYHYENKHKDDRPYAVTGGFSELDAVPLVGPILNGTIGKILKPGQEHPGLEKAHRELLAEINGNIQSKYAQVENGNLLKIGVAGGIKTLEKPARIAEGRPEDQAEINQLAYSDDEDAMTMAGMPSLSGGGGVIANGTIGGGSGGSGSFNMSSVSQMDLTFQNTLLAGGGTDTPSMPISRYASLLDPDFKTDSSDIEYVDSPSGLLRDAFYSASEVGGIYGFLTKSAIGFEEGGREQTWAPSTLMTSYQRSFWDLNLGGMGGQLSEIGRRYLPRDPNKDYYSPIRNTMPDWMPGVDYFIDFQHGDPYVKVKKGEMRLPGKAYEKLYHLSPDGTGTGEYANYGALDRFRIIADVAPYSPKYAEAKSMVSKMNAKGLLTEEQQEEFKEIRSQVSQKKDKYRWYKRRFTNGDIKQETVTVDKVIDQNTFTTKEHPNNPIRLGAVKLSQENQEAIEWLGQFIHEGAKLKIGLEGDPTKRINKDKYNSMSAVVYAPHGEEGMGILGSIKGQSLNYILANRKWGDKQVKVTDNENGVATHALFSEDMIAVGKGWEKLTHDILPQLPIVGVFADKFLQVRSAAESYERQQVYGKEWRPWTEPWKSWFVPMVETIASRNPVIAAAEGAGIGHLFTKSKYRGRGRIVGAILGGAVSSARVYDEQARSLAGDDTAWIPERRVKEREINEYFDRLRYVKYRGLYEKTKRLAMQKEGVDLDKFFDDSRKKGEANKGLRKYFHDKKKWLSIAQKSGYGDSEAIDKELESLAKNINDVEADKAYAGAGVYTSLAIQYRKEYESTIYGLDPKGADMRDLLKALPPKDRKYLPEFLASNSPKEREKILKLVPQDERRILQAKWGMKVDKKESIGEYFRHHYLPDANWEGWQANNSLDNIKVKVMQQNGVELTEAGYWDDDVQRAELAGAQAIPMQSLSSRLDITRLEEVLRGAGLSDVKIKMQVGQGSQNSIDTAFDIVKDRSQEIVDELNNSMQSIFSQLLS